MPYFPDMPRPIDLSILNEWRLTYSRFTETARALAQTPSIAAATQFGAKMEELTRLSSAAREIEAASQLPSAMALAELGRVSSEMARVRERLLVVSDPLAEHRALIQRHSDWLRDISLRLAEVEPATLYHAFEVADASGIEWREPFDEVFGDVELQGPGNGDAVSSVPDQFVGALKQAVAQPDGRGLGAVLAGFVGRIMNADPMTRGFYLFALFQLLNNILPSIVEVEYDRWRNAPEDQVQSDEVRRQTEALEKILTELRQVQERLANPPVPAKVTTAAVLRNVPDSAGGRIIVRLKAGTPILVTDRRNGWVHVVAEPIPGEVYEGWVFGRFAQYRPR